MNTLRVITKEQKQKISSNEDIIELLVPLHLLVITRNQFFTCSMIGSTAFYMKSFFGNYCQLLILVKVLESSSDPGGNNSVIATNLTQHYDL